MKAMRRPSIRDVARRAGVSVMTVSRFMNDSGYVGKESAEKIERAVAELRYRPNQIARSLQNSKSRNIAVLLGNVSSPMSALAIKGIESVSFRYGYNLLVCNTDFSEEKERAYLDMLMQKQIDGMILAPCSGNPAPLREITDREIALLFVERHVPGILADYVSFDFYNDSFNLTKHLLDIGCRQISVICREAEKKHDSPHLKGFEKALSEASFVFDPFSVSYAPPSPESGYEVMEKILEAGPAPDAVYVTAGTLAIGALRCCRKRHVNIPHDMRVACFESLGEYDALAYPSLTCNELPAFDLGVRAAEALLEKICRRIAYDTPPRRFVLPGRLLIRDSTLSYPSTEGV